MKENLRKLIARENLLHNSIHTQYALCEPS